MSIDVCVFVEPQQGQSYAEQLAFAQAAERLGFDGFFRSDHYLAIGDAFDGLPGPSDSWTVLAGLARETTRIRLGTLVSSVTFRHPGILAIQVAGVDEMSGGRVELGLGAGWNEAEHRAYGIPFPTRRLGLLEEQLAIVKGLWSTALESSFSFDGEHYTLAGAPALPKPTQTSIPVIVGGGGSSRTPRIAARFADEYNSFSGAVIARERFDRVRAAAEAIGRDPETLRYSLAMAITVGAPGDFERRVARIGGGDPNAYRRSSENVSGSVNEVIDRLGSVLTSAAPDRIYLQFLDIRDLDQLELAGSEVLPELRRMAGGRP